LNPSRERKVTFGSTVSDSFLLSRPLSKELVRDVVDFWRFKGLGAKEEHAVGRLSEGKTPGFASLVFEGGSIWTTSFEEYKKAVTINLGQVAGQTQVSLHMEFRGGFLTARDREKAIDLVTEFYESLLERG